MKQVMRIIQLISLGASLFLFVGCASQMERIEQLREQERCEVRCAERFYACDAQCTQSASRCAKEASTLAKTGYNRYIDEKRVQGGIVMRDFNSYRDPLQCSKSSCDCPADYQLCIQNCSGSTLTK